MGDLPGMERPDLQALPQIGDRLTFLYLERCQITREDSAILMNRGAQEFQRRPFLCCF